MLYRPDWHERLTDRRWGEAAVRGAVAAIVADTVGTYDVDALWPAHEWDAWGTEPPVTDVFCGAAGVVWGLARLGADFDVAGAQSASTSASPRGPCHRRTARRNGARRSSTARPGSRSSATRSHRPKTCGSSCATSSARTSRTRRTS